MPTGAVDSVFLANATALRAAAAAMASAATGGSVRPWMLGDLGLWAGDPLDLLDVGAAFLRAEVGAAYGTALASQTGSVGDAASLKTQSDHLAVQERAFRLRHATPVRLALHAAARRTGHADPAGAVGRVVTLAQDLLVAGGAGFKPPTGG